MDYLATVFVLFALLPSPNPLDWFGLTPIESLLEWAWPEPEPEGFHPVWTLAGLLKLVLVAAGASLSAGALYWLVRLRLRGGGGAGSIGGAGGPSGTAHSRQPIQRRYTERTGRRRR